MKNVTYSALLSLLTLFSLNAQTPQEIYSVAPKEVRLKMDQNKFDGKSILTGISAKHIFKVTGPINKSISDMDVHIAEAPGMINYALNLNRTWSKIRSIEFECDASFTLEEIKTYFQKVNVTITKDKVKYAVNSK